MKLAALAKKQAVLLAQLDQLIDSLGRMSPLVGRFSVQVDTTWKLRDQLVSVGPANPASSVFLDRIKQHMADLAADFATFDQKTEFGRQS